MMMLMLMMMMMMRMRMMMMMIMLMLMMLMLMVMMLMMKMMMMLMLMKMMLMMMMNIIIYEEFKDIINPRGTYKSCKWPTWNLPETGGPRWPCMGAFTNGVHHREEYEIERKKQLFYIFVQTVDKIGMLEVALCFFDLTMIILNCAFIAGSSKHGNAVRAAEDSKWVVAMYL